MASYDPAWEPVLRRAIDNVTDEIIRQVSHKRPLLWRGARCVVKILWKVERNTHPQRRKQTRGR
jgi:hypothetical protein